MVGLLSKNTNGLIVIYRAESGMENKDIAVIQDQDNLFKKEHTKELPYYIVIQKVNNKQIKIPCSNEEVAKRLLASLSSNRFKQVEPSIGQSITLNRI